MYVCMDRPLHGYLVGAISSSSTLTYFDRSPFDLDWLAGIMHIHVVDVVASSELIIIALMVRVDGLKATSLIFGRGPATTTTTTTTSTTTAAATSTTEESAEAEDEGRPGALWVL
ncbi:AGAP005488-PA [Anopheles gambiae str. PEST]|uniref:AGAP005488-PA n=1 Tax=Anopheles gambiae TaxID=7165 RepID=A0A1W5C984_ANOGA|nr:AGAP005488-PA [Anopheles gambiae str. PEST]